MFRLTPGWQFNIPEQGGEDELNLSALFRMNLKSPGKSSEISRELLKLESQLKSKEISEFTN